MFSQMELNEKATSVHDWAGAYVLMPTAAIQITISIDFLKDHVLFQPHVKGYKLSFLVQTN